MIKRFSYEESELLNSLFEAPSGFTSREETIQRLEAAKDNTEDVDLIAIAESVISKLTALDDDDFAILVKAMPLDAAVY